MRDKWLLLYSPHNYQPWYQYIYYHLKNEITLILDEIYIPIVKYPWWREIKAIVIKLSVQFHNEYIDNI